MELHFMSFSSGSCGNCYFVECGGQSVLIDAGVSPRMLKRYMNASGLSPDSVDAVLITHDHLDHIRSLGSFCKKLGKPIFAPEELHEALACHSFTSPYIASYRRILSRNAWNEVGNMKVRYFTVPHDASYTCGYAILAFDRRFFIMTDVGRVTDEAISLATQADVVVIESNYDVDMLMGGTYPHELKMRICSGSGHISNDECASAIRRFWHPGLRAVFLCHLSENNNTHEAAYSTALSALMKIPEYKEGTMILKPLPRDYPSPLYTL